MKDNMRDLGERGDRVYGERIGTVEATADPDKYLLVKVRVLGVFSDAAPVAELPWAEFKLGIGASANEGEFRPVKPGDKVWVDFPYDGDTRRPRITGSVHYVPDGVVNLPHEAFLGASQHEHKRSGEEAVPAAHGYGEDAVFTLHGITIEVGKEGTYSVIHRASGTELFFAKDGSFVIHAENDINISTTGKINLLATGDGTAEIQGELKATALGGIILDGGPGGEKGGVQGDCICPLTKKPHAMVSSNVKATL